MPDLVRDLVIPVHTVSTLAMFGVIWIVQLVHYPLMARVGESSFREYQRQHVRRITWVVGPLMLAEVATALSILIDAPSGWSERAAWTGIGLVTLAWVATALFSVPLHGRLERGFDAATHRRLVATNWIRTCVWTARAVLVATTLHGAI